MRSLSTCFCITSARCHLHTSPLNLRVAVHKHYIALHTTLLRAENVCAMQPRTSAFSRQKCQQVARCMPNTHADHHHHHNLAGAGASAPPVDVGSSSDTLAPPPRTQQKMPVLAVEPPFSAGNVQTTARDSIDDWQQESAPQAGGAGEDWTREPRLEPRSFAAPSASL